MSRQFHSFVVLLLTALTALTGCHPTQPFYFAEDGDLSHYLDQVTDIEYPDVATAALPDAAESQDPLTISNPEFKEIWDVTLEECIAIALQNSKTIRNLGGVTPFGFADALVDRSGQTTIYDPAISETNPGRSPHPIFTGGPGSLQSPSFADAAPGVEAALAEFDAAMRIVGGVPGTLGGLYSRTDRPTNSTAFAEAFFPLFQDQDDAGLRTEIIKKSPTGARFTITNLTNYTRYNNNTKGFRTLSNEWTPRWKRASTCPCCVAEAR